MVKPTIKRAIQKPESRYLLVKLPHTETMSTSKQLRLLKPGAPFTVETVPTPKSSAQGVAGRIKAIRLNPLDWKGAQMGFRMPVWPAVLGSDYAGGGRVGGRRPGHRVPCRRRGLWHGPRRYAPRDLVLSRRCARYRPLSAGQGACNFSTFAEAAGPLGRPRRDELPAALRLSREPTGPPTSCRLPCRASGTPRPFDSALARRQGQFVQVLLPPRGRGYDAICRRGGCPCGRDRLQSR